LVVVIGSDNLISRLIVKMGYLFWQ